MSEFREIQEVTKIRRGASPRPIDDQKYFGGDIGWVRISDVTRSKRYLRKTEQYLSPLGESLSVRVGHGDIIMSICGTIGRPIVVDMLACIHDGFVQFYQMKGIINSYLYYALQHSETAFNNMGQPGTQTNLNTTLAGRHRIFCPNIAEQQKIAQVLSLIDEAIEHTESLIAKYQQIKAGLMHDLFTRGITADGKLRPPREQAPKLYKETPIGWIPKDWKTGKIGDLFNIQLGKMLSKASKTGKWSRVYLGNKNVQWGKVNFSNLEEMDFLPAEREKFRLALGDLLVCEGGDVGRTAIWNGELEECYYQKAIHRLRPKDGRIIPKYVLQYMRYMKDRSSLNDYTSQTSIAHLTQEQFSRVQIAVPSQMEQRLVCSRFDNIDLKLDMEQEHLLKLKKQKSGLMHDLLTGHMRIMVKTIGVANVVHRTSEWESKT